MTAETLSRWTTGLMVLLLAYSLAELTWRLWPGAGLGAGVEPVTGSRPAEASERPGREDLAGRIIDLHLFGRVDVEPTPAPEDVADAPETRLDLTLRGVLATGERETARAIIQVGSGDEESFGIGATVTRGAVIREIRPDRVLLEREGRLETLRLPREELPEAVERARASSGGGREELAWRLSQYRRELVQDPQQAMELLRVQPVSEDGRLKGYRLTPLKEKELFRQAGLRPGDVLKSVNGMALSDPTRMGEVMRELSTADRLVLTVDRGGRQQTVVVRVGG